MRNKIIIALILALVTFICIGCAGCRKISRLQSELDRANSNILAYQEGYKNAVDMSAVLKLRADEMANSRDSVILRLDSVRKALRIKDKQLQIAQSISSITTYTDTVYIDKLIVKDGVCVDTIIVDDWYKLQVNVCDGLLVVTPEFKSETSIFMSERKEIVGKPSKFALFRLFQKKRIVKRYDIVEMSPYSKTTGTRFIEITE